MNDTIDAKNVGNNILRYRQNIEMSQSELAGLLCVSRTVVSRWETGDRLPETQMLPRICKVFGISLEELLYENNENVATVKEPESENEHSKILFGFTKWPGTSQEKLNDVLNNVLSGNQIENEIYVAFYFFTFPIKTISAMFNIKTNEIHSYISIVNKRIFEALRENSNTNRHVTKIEFITAVSNIKNIEFGKIILKKTEADMEANHKRAILVPMIISVIAFTLTGLSLSYFITRQNISVGSYGWGQKKPNNAIIIKTSPEEKDEATQTASPSKTTSPTEKSEAPATALPTKRSEAPATALPTKRSEAPATALPTESSYASATALPTENREPSPTDLPSRTADPEMSDELIIRDKKEYEKILKALKNGENVNSKYKKLIGDKYYYYDFEDEFAFNFDYLRVTEHNIDLYYRSGEKDLLLGVWKHGIPEYTENRYFSDYKKKITGEVSYFEENNIKYMQINAGQYIYLFWLQDGECLRMTIATDIVKTNDVKTLIKAVAKKDYGS